MSEHNHPIQRLLLQLGLFVLCATFVFCFMVVCSTWSVAFSDPNPAQHFWLAVGKVLGFPTDILPAKTDGSIQFAIVLVFWSGVVYGFGYLLAMTFHASTCYFRSLAATLRFRSSR